MRLRRPLGQGGEALADHAQESDLRADRRHRRRADDVAARAHRAARATGTTATAGCATRRSRSMRCCSRATETKPPHGAIGCCARPPADPQDLQTLYGVDGDRVRTEFEIPWLAGYAGSKPVRVGNARIGAVAARRVRRVDRRAVPRADARGSQRSDGRLAIRGSLFSSSSERAWSKPDHGIWETRGEKRHFTHSKVMAWVAFDRAIHDIEEIRLPRPRRALAQAARAIHADICAKGFDRTRNTFVQYYGAKEVDASLLLIPQVGFLPPEDPRVRAPSRRSSATSWSMASSCAIAPCRPSRKTPPHEGRFLACSFWLADASAPVRAQGRRRKAVRAPASPVQRRRLARRGIRSASEADARQFSAGAVAHGARQHRAQPVAAGRTGGASQRARLQTPRPLIASLLVRP